MKQYLFILLILVLLVACKPLPDPDQLREQQNKEAVTITEPDGSLPSVEISDTMDRYADFEAALACELASASVQDDPEKVLAAMQKSAVFAEEYGFKAEQLPELTDRYKEDPIFLALAQEKMVKLCPEEIAALKAQN